LIFLMIFFIGCSEEGTNVIDQSFKINVNNQTLMLVNEEFAGNENCNTIFVSASVFKNEPDIKFRIEFQLTIEGLVKNVLLVDYSDHNRHYKTAIFNSSETFTVQNFQYDSIAHFLYFEFSGLLYDVGNENKTLPINGEIQFSFLQDINCSFEPWVMNADVNQTKISCVLIQGRSTAEKTEWYGFTDSGIKLTILLPEALSDIEVGTYPFTIEDKFNIVTIEKYIGQTKASFTPPVYENEWESYQYEGQFVITEQVKSSKTYTKGFFTFKAFKNGILIYKVENGKFLI
jgi:hypothetical protein